MDERRILVAAITLALFLTPGCGSTAETPTPALPTASPEPLDTLPPATPTSGITVTPEAPLVQIGFFSSIYLRYDPAEWEVFSEAQDGQQNNQGEAVESLRHRSIPGCILHDNLGRGVPPSWELESSERSIGGLEYRVEAWTDTDLPRPVLRVYQYPAGPSGPGTRIELVIDQEPADCIRSAEDVLALSADLIAP
jgi:hypothetical protein